MRVFFERSLSASSFARSSRKTRDRSLPCSRIVETPTLTYMLSHQVRPSRKSLQQIGTELESREGPRGKTARAADSDPRSHAAEETDQRVKVVLDAEGEARTDGEVRVHVDGGINIEKGFQAILAEVAPVTTV